MEVTITRREDGTMTGKEGNKVIKSEVGHEDG